MANRLLLSIRMDAENGGYQPGPVNLTNLEVTQATQGADGRIVDVTTAEMDITFNVATHGYLLLRNLDETNYITYGPKSGGVMVALGRLKAGEAALLRLEPGVTFWAKADTATCKLWVRMEND